jgi:hypothetical protein
MADDDGCDLVTKIVVDLREKGWRKYIPHQKTVDNKQFVRISKFDRFLCRFALKKTLQWKTHVDCNVPFMDELITLRTAACAELVMGALMQDVDDEGDRKKLKRRRIKKSDGYLTDDIVTINIPEAGDEPATTMRVLYGVKSEAIFIEFTKDNLSYIAKRIRTDFTAGLRGRSRTAKTNASPNDGSETDKTDTDA